jgi:hypothetical protein
MDVLIDRPRIFSHLTRTRFLHIEDALERGKFRFFIGAFEKGSGANSTAYAFLDIDDARVIFSDMSWGRPVDFKDYKGGRDANHTLISRVLKINTKEDKVWFELQNGAGEEVGKGGVKPRGEPFAVISIPFSIFDSRKLAHACLAYLHAWDVLHLLRVTPDLDRSRLSVDH